MYLTDSFRFYHVNIISIESQANRSRVSRNSIEIQPKTKTQSSEITVAAVLEDYTRDEVRCEVLIFANWDPRAAQFYDWLPYCFISISQDLYRKRDVQKILFVTNQLKRVRNLEIARQKLIQRIENCPEELNYEPN